MCVSGIAIRQVRAKQTHFSWTSSAGQSPSELLPHIFVVDVDQDVAVTKLVGEETFRNQDGCQPK